MGELATNALQFDESGARVAVNYTEPWDADMVRGCKCEPLGGDWPRNATATRVALGAEIKNVPGRRSSNRGPESERIWREGSVPDFRRSRNREANAPNGPRLARYGAPKIS